jgi:hypothetical protein
MRHRSEDTADEEGGGSLDVFLVAGGAEPAAFAGEGQEIFVLAVVAAEAGEAAVEVAAVDKLVDHLRYDRAQAAQSGLIVIGVDSDKLSEVPVGTLPEG